VAVGFGLEVGVGVGVGLELGAFPGDVDEDLLPAERLPPQELSVSDRQKMATTKTARL
jgi:hypothetical protein